MAQDKINMPTSTAGLTRYFDDYKSKIRIKPGYVVALIVVIIILLLLLNMFFKNTLGT